VTEGDEEGAFRINSAVIGRSVACFKYRRRVPPPPAADLRASYRLTATSDRPVSASLARA